MRKKISIVLIFTLLCLNAFVLAGPSDWAIEPTENAIENNLVPVELQDDYQKDITRTEYVLIAIKVLEKYNVPLTMENANPFLDSIGHKYETQIHQAYEAGVISGYNSNTFKPDDLISREEVTSLVFKLVKAINPETITGDYDFEFSDKSQISIWAIPYVEFCYKNEIMNGIGKVDNLDTIDPKGNATREQAIKLLYELTLKDTLLNKSLPSIVLKDGSTSDALNSFVETTQYNVGEHIMKLQEEEDADVSFLDKNFVEVTFGEKDTLSVNSIDGSLSIRVDMYDGINSDLINDFIETIKLFEFDKAGVIDKINLYAYESGAEFEGMIEGIFVKTIISESEDEHIVLKVEMFEYK